MDGLHLRSYRGAADDGGVSAVRAAVRAVEGDVWLPDPDTPASLIAEVGAGRIVGFARMDHWDEADGTRLYLLTGCVDPALRRRGIGRTILRAQQERAVAHWRADPGPGPALLGGNADENQPDTLALLLAAGFRVRFTLVDLACDPRTIRREIPPLPAGLEVRPVEPAHHPRIYAALETCFADAGHGQQPLSYAEYLDDSQDTGRWLIAWDGGEVAALVITEALADGAVDTPWVAVLPSWRRRGVAAALMARTVRLLADDGVAEARIRTVQENANDTVGLYQKVGYRVVGRVPRYSKPLATGPQ
jgi:mycothiol synthase